MTMASIFEKDWFERDCDFVLRTTDSIGWADACKGGAFSSYIYSDRQVREMLDDKRSLAIELMGFSKSLTETNPSVHITDGVDKGCTNGKRITIGRRFSGKVPTDGDKLDLLIGIMLHECCHIKWTDFEHVNNAMKGEKKIVHTIHNILEDEMIEERLTALYPGYANYLSKLKYYLFGEFGKNIRKRRKYNHCVNEIMKLLLYVIRYPKYLEDVAPATLAKYEELFTDIYEILKVNGIFSLSTASTAKATMKAARAIYLLLVEYVRTHPNEVKKPKKSTKIDLDEIDLDDEDERDEDDTEDEDDERDDDEDNGFGIDGDSPETAVDDDDDSEGEWEEGEGDDDPLGENEGSGGSLDGDWEESEGDDDPLGENEDEDEDEEPTMSTEEAEDSIDGACDEDGSVVNEIDEINRVSSESECDEDEREGYDKDVEQEAKENPSYVGEDNEGRYDPNSKPSDNIGEGNDVATRTSAELAYAQRQYMNYLSTVKDLIPEFQKVLVQNSYKNEFSRQTYLRNGSLDSSRIVDAVLGHPSVYQRMSVKNVAKGTKCAYVIMLDESGSMLSGDIHTVATKLAILFYEALKNEPEVEVYIYGHGDCVVTYLDKYHTNPYVLGDRMKQGNQNEEKSYRIIIDKVREQTNLPIVAINITDTFYLSSLNAMIDTVNYCREQRCAVNLLALANSSSSWYGENQQSSNDAIYGIGGWFSFDTTRGIRELKVVANEFSNIVKNSFKKAIR